ncbi:MAG: VWA domain-containing protein [Planctomycetes bacterium]|nr:VWA domain-containing protein [Planctomycetota bacterium]
MSGFLEIGLLRPAELWWLLAAAALLGLGGWALRARSRDLDRWVARRHRPGFARERSAWRGPLRLVLAAAAFAFLALALSGPVRGYTLRDVQRRGLDLVVCLDTSRSMLVEDLRPNRLERAKREIVGLLQRLHGDRVAVLAFAGDVRTVAPLTHDRKTLASFLETLSPADNQLGGTDLGAALEQALLMFDGRNGNHEAIVLLTDGEDLGGEAQAAAEKAAERGIRVYVVGLGTPEGGKIPDGSRGFVKDESGVEVVSALDGTTLERIAEVSGGVYLAAATTPLPLEEMYDKRMTKLEARELFAGRERIPHDRYQWPLVIAFLCMLGETSLRERRGRWEGRA